MIPPPRFLVSEQHLPLNSLTLHRVRPHCITLIMSESFQYSLSNRLPGPTESSFRNPPLQREGPRTACAAPALVDPLSRGFNTMLGLHSSLEEPRLPRVIRASVGPSSIIYVRLTTVLLSLVMSVPVCSLSVKCARFRFRSNEGTRMEDERPR